MKNILVHIEYTCFEKTKQKISREKYKAGVILFFNCLQLDQILENRPRALLQAGHVCNTSRHESMQNGIQQMHHGKTWKDLFKCLLYCNLILITRKKPRTKQTPITIQAKNMYIIKKNNHKLQTHVMHPQLCLYELQYEPEMLMKYIWVL